MSDIRYGEEEGRLVECAVNSPTMVSGIKVVGVSGGMVYLAIWIRQPSLDGYGMESTVIGRFVMAEADFVRDNAENRAIAFQKVGRREGDDARH